MNRMINWIFAVTLALSITIGAHAADSTDICAKLPGHWHGVENIKGQDDCERFHGCVHAYMLNAKLLKDNTYLLEGYFIGANYDGISHQKTVVKCEDGKIQVSGRMQNSSIHAMCDEMNHCFITVDNPRFTAELVNQ